MATSKVWAQMLSGILGNLAKNGVPDVGAPRRVLDQLAQWFGHLSQNAAREWTPMLLADTACAFCDEDALVRCIKCGDPTCLVHAHVSYRAEGICDECVSQTIEEAPKQKTPSRARSKKSDVANAFEFFNLTSKATFEEVTAVYRARIRDAHPDKGGSEQAATRVNQMFEVLKLHFELKAA